MEVPAHCPRHIVAPSLVACLYDGKRNMSDVDAPSITRCGWRAAITAPQR
jgi:hypothetical protein